MMDFGFLLWVVSFLGIKLVAYSLVMRPACDMFDRPAEESLKFGAARLATGLLSIPLIMILFAVLSEVADGHWIWLWIPLVSFANWGLVVCFSFDPLLKSPRKVFDIAAIGMLLSAFLDGLFIVSIKFLEIPLLPSPG